MGFHADCSDSRKYNNPLQTILKAATLPRGHYHGKLNL